MGIVIGLICGLAVMAVLIKPIFGDASGLMESIKSSFLPDIYVLFKKNKYTLKNTYTFEDWWMNQLYFLIWVGAGVLTTYVVFKLFEKIFG